MTKLEKLNIQYLGKPLMVYTYTTFPNLAFLEPIRHDTIVPENEELKEMNCTEISKPSSDIMSDVCVLILQDLASGRRYQLVLD